MHIFSNICCESINTALVMDLKHIHCTREETKAISYLPSHDKKLKFRIEIIATFGVGIIK